MDMIAQIFASHFGHWGITLPSDAFPSPSRGRIEKSGWRISYLSGQDATGQYLDYYASHRMTNDRHIRIYATGDVKCLPAMQDLRLCSTDPEEDAKLKTEYIENNRIVEELLRRKGF